MLYFYKESICISLFEKGKPAVRLGPKLRLSAFALNYAWPGEAKCASNLAKTGQNYRALKFKGSQLPVGNNLFAQLAYRFFY